MEKSSKMHWYETQHQFPASWTGVMGKYRDQEPRTKMSWTERISHTVDVPSSCAITQLGAPILHASCDCTQSRSMAGKLRLCWLESKDSQTGSVFCFQALVMCQVSLIND